MHYVTISELSVQLRNKTLSPVELVDHMLNRIAALEPQLSAFVTVTAERARQQAISAEQEIVGGNWRGALHGVPVAFKDIIYSSFAPTTAGTLIHKDFRPEFSATVLRRMEMAGAITLGKLKTTEQAWADHHPSVTPPKNPWNAAVWPGASSSGSGVATAAGLAYGTLGSDTGGSIRFPSAANGLTGLKPTWGRVSRYGVFELAASLDHIGPLARSATDCAILLGAIAGADAADPTAVAEPLENYETSALDGVAGLRIGLPRSYATDGIDPEVVKVWEQAAAVLSSLGAIVREVDFPAWREVAESWETICSPETARAHAATYPSKSEQYGEMLAALIESGRNHTAVELAAAHQLRLDFSGRLRALFLDCDLLLIPVIAWPTPSLDSWRALASGSLADVLRFTAPFNISGSPTLTLPAGFDNRGLPIAVQLVGRHFCEGTILRAGSAFQRATDWHGRHPGLFP